MPDAPAPVAYQAQVASSALTGQASLRIGEDGLDVDGLFQPVFIDFADIVELGRADYVVGVRTTSDQFTFSGLGNQCDGFYMTLMGAFNAKVRRALFVQGQPAFQGDGDIRYREGAVEVQGHGLVEVYDDCVVLLPPNDQARRVPLVFANDMRPEPFGAAIKLDGGDWYEVTRLGRDADAFDATIKAKLAGLRQKSVEAVRALDASLSQQQLSTIAAKMPPGAAVPLGELAGVAPSYVAALEQRVADSRAAATYTEFKTVCDPDRICVGLKDGLAGSDDPGVLWFIAPSSSKPVAAVEWAVDEGESAATFFYNIVGDETDFVRRLNRAIEAVEFHREVVSLPAEELGRPSNNYYAMAVRRTQALQFMRDNLAGRVIHNSPDAWSAGMRALMVG
ncbi:MAG: hypothetical protein FWD63_06845 [Propionibacteriaceae bacterium]|nr:hypothetical protein [Propionibacteriaceae bacterium]